MSRLHPHHTGLILGGFMGVVHAFWALLVLTGVAQGLMDFIFRLHMIEPVYRMTAFHWGTAAALVVVVGGIGYVMGLVFAVLWNAWSSRATLSR